MVRRHATIALAALIVVARLASGASSAIASSSVDPSIRKAKVAQPAPTRTARMLTSSSERSVARTPSLGAWLVTAAFVLGDPLRVTAPPPIVPLPALVSLLAPPIANARAPPV